MTVRGLNSIGFFGKIPSRGDFVKASENPALIKILDDWLAGSMDLLSADARWKLMYDAVAPLQFAFVGPRRRRTVAGHITASADQSNRRFPFLIMSMMSVEDPARFVPNCPVILTGLWNRLEVLSSNVMSAADPGPALHAAATQVNDLDLRAPAHDAAFAEFISSQTVGALDALLAPTGFDNPVRQVMLALGMLLQPVMSSGSSRLEKSLVLPLPADPAYRNLVGAFWMHLITPFLAHADFELSLFMTSLRERPSLVLGFSGASAQTLQAIMDPQAAQEHHITFDDLSWVEDQIATDPTIHKVSTYLAQADLSLTSAHDSIRAAFIGI